MMPDDRNQSDVDDQQLERALEEAVSRPGWLRDMPFYATSAVLHLVLLLVLIYWVVPREPVDPPRIPLVVRPQAVQQPPYDPTIPERDVKRQLVKIVHRRPVERPVIPRKLDEVTEDLSKGTDLEKLSNVNLNSNLLNDTIGIGPGGTGPYGWRFGRHTREDIGAPELTEGLVLAALEWLWRHQAPDGGWRCHDFTDMCPGSTPCSNLDPAYGDGRGFPEHDVGVTALAMLAFTGFGETHKFGSYPKFVRCLQRAADYLKRVQVRSSEPATNGRYGPGDHEQWIYDHAIATMAMAELLVLSNDVIGLKRSVRDAVKLCLRAQNPGRGWRYGVRPGDNDTSVTGWMVLALKTAKNARLGIPPREFDRAFEGALEWFDYATASNGKTGYFVPGDEGSRLARGHPAPYPYSKELSCMTAVGVLCRIFAGHSRKDAALRDGVKVLATSLPSWQERKGRSLSRVNLYYWYYGSYALFQCGGKEWRRWNEAMLEALKHSQRNPENGNRDVDGSWDPIGEWGLAGGRVYSTALGAMTLEVYYRFRRLEEGVGF
jgi:hypothetical protein